MGAQALCQMQVIAIKQQLYERKQSAIQNVLLVGDQIARRKRQSIGTSILAAWQQEARVSIGVQHLRKQNLKRLVSGCLMLWRQYAEIKVSQQVSQACRLIWQHL